MAIQRFNCIELLTRVDASEEARMVWEPYDNTKTYVKYNKVVYMGSSYQCLEDCTGKPPTDTTYWMCIAARGTAGTGLDIKGTYTTVELLAANITSPEQGDMYNVGTAAPYELYMWDSTVGSGAWVSQGYLQGPTGERGATGATGATGEKGDKGDKGDTGEPGNIMYATFEVNPQTGILSMTTPDAYNGPQFAIDSNGFLGVTI